MKLACARWQAKYDFEIACNQIGEKPSAVHIVVNGHSFIFNGSASPFNSSSMAQIARSKILFYQLMRDVVNSAHDFALSRSVAYFAPGQFDYDDTATYKNAASIDAIISSAESEFDYPVVVKPDKGSRGRAVSKVSNSRKLRAGLQEVFFGQACQDSTAVVQEHIQISKEFRAICFEGKCVVLYEKNADDAQPGENLNRIYWEGARPVLVEDDLMKRKCDRLAQLLYNNYGFVHYGLDIALDQEGVLWLIEANSSPMGLGRLETYYGTELIEDITDKMMKRIVRQAGLRLAC